MNIQNLDNLNKTTRYVNYNPVKVGNTMYVNGKKVNNIVQKQIAQQPITGRPADMGTTPINPIDTVGGLVTGTGMVQIRRGQAQGGLSDFTSTSPFVGSESVPSNNTFNNTAPSAQDIVELNGPAFDQPAINRGIDSSEVGGTSAGDLIADAITNTVLPGNETPFDTGIRFNKRPKIQIIPKVFGEQGALQPAGAPATVELRRPTPAVKIPAEKFYGIDKGTELLLNGKKIIIRGVDTKDVAQQINCGNFGISASTTPGANDGVEDLMLTSCGPNGFTVANGCGGGVYKQVGDFHINRGFEQQRNLNTTKSVQANATLIPHTLTATTAQKQISTANKNGQIKSLTDQETKLTLPTISLDEQGNVVEQINEEGFGTGKYAYYYGEITSPDLPDRRQMKNVMLPAITETESNTSVYSVGGSGYRVGDRLRLVGGTPVTMTKAPITKICIDSAGSGFTNPANLQILFNENSSNPKSTGIGAAAAVTRLDAIGGIQEIQLLSGGAGYDVNPPRLLCTIEAQQCTLTLQKSMHNSLLN